LRVKRTFTAVVERSPETGLFVGYVPGFPGAHTQAESLDELNANLREVVEMLLEDGEPRVEAEFVGTQLVEVEWCAEAAGPEGTSGHRGIAEARLQRSASAINAPSSIHRHSSRRTR
jgi:predicted RNase H-like HicB family nuclease